MPSLSSLIVQRQVATIAEVEQAIARQVIHGGDLVTNLLEVAPKAEQALSRVLGESLGLPAMPPGRLPAPANDALDLVPVETALRFSIFPLRLSQKTLVVASYERLKPTATHDLSYMLGVDLTQVAAPLIRIREGIAAHYGVPLEPRQLRLVQRLDGLPEHSPRSVRPPPMTEALSILPSMLSSGVSERPPPPEEAPVTVRKSPTDSFEPIKSAAAELRDGDSEAPRDTLDEAKPLLASVPEEVPAAPVAFPEPEAAHDPPADHEVAFAVVAAEGTEAAAASPPPEPELLPESPVPNDSPRPPGMVDRRAALTLLKREVGKKRRVARTARKKGPFARVDAERELSAAQSPENVLDTFFAFGSQFFEYSALFVVHNDLVEGRDAWGPGADHLRVLGLGVPLDLPSSFASVRRDGHVLLSPFDEHELDRELLRDLSRPRTRASLVALVPLTVKGRAVAMLFGDDGPQDVTLSSLGELLGFSALASAELERLALVRKTKKGPYAGIVAPRAPPGSVAALARVFGGSAPSAESLDAVIGRAERQSVPPAPSAEAVRQTLVHASDASPAAPSVTPLPIERMRGSPRPFRHGTMAGVGERIETPSAGTPAHYEEPRISPGATSVKPPKPELSTDDPLARQPESLEPDPYPPDTDGQRELDPALAETALPGLSAMLDSALDRGAAETLGYEELRVVPQVQAATPPAPSSDVESRKAAGQFRKPIPRVDEEDASAIVAEHVEDWQESPRPALLRHDLEPESHDGRVGSYHLVPRPAEARHRGEASDVDHLLEHALSGGLEGEEALSELLRRAEHEFPRLIERFPGPLVVDRLRARSDLPPASECGPLLKVVVMARRAALPFMTVRSAAPDVEQRFWATHVLGELLFPEASNAILPRLFDDDLSVRRVARRAAQALSLAGAAGEPLRQSLDHTMLSLEEPMQRRLLAIEALSEIRVPVVVPTLIGGLRDKSEAIAEAARTALMVVTRQDLGKNPDVWTAWWGLHQDEHRIVWLIQALTHETPSIRRAAGDELKMLTREYFGYYDDLPLKERERAQARYLEWWRDDGQYRFR